MLFFFNDTATTEIYTLSLHDALPICHGLQRGPNDVVVRLLRGQRDTRGLRVEAHQHRLVGGCPVALLHPPSPDAPAGARSAEHTSELQSRHYLVCRLLLAKKNRFSNA